MAFYNSFPPQQILAVTPISPSEALDKITGYLELANENPAFRPGAVLTETGPAAPLGSGPGLVLHNLQRVQAGLRGEHLASDLQLEEFLGLKKQDDEGPGRILAVGKDGDLVMEDSTVAAEWQDKDEYDREQSEREGNIGDSHGAILEQPGAAPGQKVEATQQEKQLRKQRKKERKLQEKREKQARKEANRAND